MSDVPTVVVTPPTVEVRTQMCMNKCRGRTQHVVQLIGTVPIAYCTICEKELIAKPVKPFTGIPQFPVTTD